MTTTVNLASRLRPGSQYRAIHGASPGSPLHAALASCDRWQQLADRLAALPPWGAGTAGTADAAAAVDQLVSEAMDAGQPLDDPDLHRDAARVHSEAQGRLLVAQALDRHRGWLLGEIDAAFVGSAGRVLRHLADQLDRLLSEARGILDELGDIRDSEDAVDAGLLEQLRAWRILPAKYAAIREAQVTVLKALGVIEAARDASVFAFLQSPTAVDQDFYARRLGWNAGTVEEPRRPAEAPWPDLTSPDALEWVLDHDETGPWVPTVAELEEAERACERVTQALRTRLAGVPAHARVISSASLEAVAS